MSEIPRSRRRFLRDCSAGALAIASAGSGCNREEPPPPEQPRTQLSDVLESIRPDAATGTSEAVVVKGKHCPLVFTDQIRPRNPSESVSKQFSDVMEQLRDNLMPAGSGWGALIRMHFYVRTDETAGGIRAVIARVFQEVHKPAATFTRGELEFPDVAFVMDAVSLSGEIEFEPKDKIRSPGADAPSVRRSDHAVVLPQGPLLFVSGETKPGSLDEATRATLVALESMLKLAGCTWADVAQLKSFVTPISGAKRVRSVVNEYLGDRQKPMLCFVEWQSTSSPIEIELVARVRTAWDDQRPGFVEYLTPPGVTKSPVFSRAAIVKTQRLIYTSGLYGDGPDAAARIRDIFADLRTLTEQSGGNFDQLVKATYYVQDAESSKLLNEIRPEFYSADRPPAASKAIVRGVGRNDRKITVDMIAAGN